MELTPPGDLSIRAISSFGRDGSGEVYICDLRGEVLKIVPREMVDVNGDGVADSCRCPADWDGDGATNSNDISEFLSSWLAALSGGC